MQVTKPWGFYEDYVRESNIVIKRMVINAGQAISLQKHECRSEEWYVMEGYFSVQVNGAVLTRNGPCRIEISAGDIHRIKNYGKEPLTIYEIQIGICSEEDIIRLEDDYGRTT